MADRDVTGRTLGETLVSGRGVTVLLMLIAASLFPSWRADRSRPLGRPLAIDPLQSSAVGERVPARLWQDPLAAAYRHAERALIAKQALPGAERLHEHLIDKLAVADPGVKADDTSLLVMLAVVEGGSQPNDVETRLRYRYAVVSALGHSGYTPLDGERIGYFALDGAGRLEGQAGIVPYELFRRVPALISNGAVDEQQPRWTHTLLVWVDGDLLRVRPADVLLSLPGLFLDGKKPGGQLAGRSELRVLWTTGSTSLLGLLDDWRRLGPDLEHESSLAGSVYVSSATVPDDVLARSLGDDFACDGPFERRFGPSPWSQSHYVLPALAASGQDSWRLYRTIGDDRALVRELLGEIALRVGQPEGERIAIFAEWDTDYGRAWKGLFEEVARDEFKQWDLKIRAYTYQSGIDGRVPGDEGPSSTEAEEATGLEWAEARGRDRLDYVVRLVDRIRSLHKRGRPYDAIGVLGSDVHDKLLLLSVLRDRFPGTVFFTTDLDARYLDPRGFEYLRNLVVVSHYGIDLKQKLQGDIPPFRNSYQASLYHATLLALGDDDARKYGSETARVYEVARHGAFDLTTASDSDPTRVVARDPLRSELLDSDAILLLAALVLGACLLFLVTRISSPSRSASPHLRGQLYRTGVLLGLAFVFVFVMYASQDAAEREPFALLEGVSVWPTELLRLLAASLALGWQYRVLRDLRAEVEHARGDLGLRAPGERAISAEVRMGLVESTDERREPRAPSRWGRVAQALGYPLPAKDPHNPHEVYEELKRWSADRPRRKRSAGHMLIFVVLAFCVFIYWGFPFKPIRGDLARVADKVALIFSVALMQWLIFLVIDSAMIVSRFVQRIADLDLVDPDLLAYQKTEREKLLKDQYIWSKRCIEVTAQLTQTIGKFLYYPSLVIFLMVLSRLPAFDDWTWPVPLVIVVGLSLLATIVCYLVTWAAARRLRTKVLGRLIQEKGETFSDERVTRALDEYIGEVRRIRSGAFAPFWEHPLLRAVLIPFAGMGSLSLLELIGR